MGFKTGCLMSSWHFTMTGLPEVANLGLYPIWLLQRPAVAAAVNKVIFFPLHFHIHEDTHLFVKQPVNHQLFLICTTLRTVEALINQPSRHQTDRNDSVTASYTLALFAIQVQTHKNKSVNSRRAQKLK